MSSNLTASAKINNLPLDFFLRLVLDWSHLDQSGPLNGNVRQTRKGELMSLQRTSIDLKRRTIRFLDTKNGESRTVPLAETAVATIKEWRCDKLPTGKVFPLATGTIDLAWQEAMARARLDDVRFHDLRHSAASYLAMSGAPLIDIAAILGHKTLAMVKRYSHLSEQHTTAAIDRMAGEQ